MVTALKHRLSYIGVQVGDAHDTAVEYAASLHGLRKLTDKEAVCYVGWTEVPLPAAVELSLGAGPVVPS